ncbi:MAG: hypothetical protein ACI9FJ_002561 [Alteromonadaceae bacterium]|jgi:uncharacterized protein (DUF2164 family)
MTKIKLSPQQKNAIVNKIQRYFARELDQDIGDFDAEFLLDFFSENVGGYYYNQGLYDAQTVLAAQLDNINEAIDVLEKETFN